MIQQYKTGTRITANFNADEFLCKCKTCQAAGIVYLDDTLITMLQGFRILIGKPIDITSGNRCAARNTAVKGAKDSRHLSPKHCDGVDIRVKGIMPDDLAVMAEAFGFTGVGVYKAGNDYIHVDTRPGARVCWWLKTSGSNTPGFGGVATVFKQGHRSPAITKIQQALYDAGYLTNRPNGGGTMDITTVRALKVWQASHGLTPDGMYGRGSNGVMRLFEWGE